MQIRTPTQAELIARALDNEEGNIVSHRDYLRFEEEKRKRAQVVRASVRGPLLKWISRGEDTKVVIPPPPAPPIQPSAPYPGGVTTAATTLPYPYSGTVAFYNPYMTGSVQPPPPSLPPPQPTIRVEKVNKNYVVHELGQYETVPQPLWQETMTAMFGDHVKWEDLKVYVTKGRPFCEFPTA